MDTVTIDNRSEFALWAIQCAQDIVAREGAALALAARDMNEAELAKAASDLGTAISDALTGVFDGLVRSE